jgi:hypothetical protein
MHRAWIISGLTASALALVVAPHPALLKRGAYENPKKTPITYSALQRDEITFYNDQKTLRRALRHHLNPMTIAEDRTNVQEDWMNIVVDRDPREQESNGWLTELARRQQRSESSTKRHS